MGHVQRRRRSDGNGNVRVSWRARYRDPSGRERSRTFERRIDAERFLTSVEGAKLKGEWIDPEAGKVTVAEFAPRWLRTKAGKKAKTRHGYQELLRARVLPRFGDEQLGAITREDVDLWIADMIDEGLSASRIRQSFNVLAGVLDLAVAYDHIMRSPARGRVRGGRTGRVELPRIPRSRRRFLSADEVATLAEALAAAAPPIDTSFGHAQRTLAYVLAYGGMRFSEVVALRRADCELLRRRVMIDENAVEVGGQLVWDDYTKNDRHHYARLPAFVCDLLGHHLEHRPNASDTLVFAGIDGGPLRHNDWYRTLWQPAVRTAGLDGLTPHELRHTAASLLIAAGADPKGVQEQLGHASITITYDVYGHLFDQHLDEVLDRLDEAGRQAAAAPTRPEDGPDGPGDIIRLTS
ncbi:MAG: site-specific integrase [Nitriliruptorales bacterium]|nr:site-specific integrase [Nitriliruptorales bacterium]